MSQPKFRIYVMLFLVLIVGGWLLRFVDWHGSTQLHTLMELAATLLALFVGGLALVRYYTKKTNLYLFVGAGFLGTGLLDGYHMVVTSSFFAVFFPSPPPSLIPWSWVASRLFLGLMMWLSVVFWRYEVQLEREGREGRLQAWHIYLGSGLLALFSFLFFAFVPLPRAYYPELFFYRPEEFVPALFFLFALIGYFKKGDWQNDEFEHWLMMSLIVGFVGQSVFMSFSGQLFDFEFDMAHLLKKVSYVCVLLGLSMSMFFLFQKAEQSTLKIQKANEELTVQMDERLVLEKSLREHQDTLEERVRTRTAELERSNQELDQFAYVASHDLKAPLRAVDNLAQWVAEDLGTDIPEETARHLKLMQQRVVRMEGLLDDLLHYSRAGRYEYQSEVVNCNMLIEEVVLLLDPPETFNVKVVSDLPTFETFKVPLLQTFQNLIGNAIKHHPRQDGHVRIDVSEAGDWWQFSIEDDGDGIAPEYHRQVFEMFKKLKSRDEVEGSGMGLAVVKKVIESFGGHIVLKSEKGQGTCFEFQWPKMVIQKS